LREIADFQVRHRAGFAVKILVHASHDAQKGGFTRSVQAEYADFGTREEGEGDIFQDFTLRRHYFAEPMHAKYVLSHGA
jgi:hypothetical protein